MYWVNISQLEAVYGDYLIINPPLRMYLEIHCHRVFGIDNVKINIFLVTVREWLISNGMIVFVL